MKGIRMYSLATILGLAVGAIAAEPVKTEVEAAFDRAMMDSRYLFGAPDDNQVLKEHPEEFERLLKARLVKGGQRPPHGEAERLVEMLHEEHKLPFLREVLATYGLDDETMPHLLVNALAALGEEQDMAMTTTIISRDPDGERSRELASIMAFARNPHAWATLVKLKEIAPGKWLESINVKARFRWLDTKEGMPQGTSAPASTPASAPAAIEIDSAPAPAVPPFAASAPIADAAPETDIFPWFWALGALAVVIAGLAVAMRRRG